MNSRVLSATTLALLIMSTVAVGPSIARQSVADEAASEHARIVEFWTVERMAAATPRELLAVERDPQARGGNGGGNGGGKGGGGGCVKKSTCSPVVTIDAPAPDATVAGTVDILGTASDADGNLDTVSVTVDGNDLTVTGTATWSASWDSTSVADGLHTIEATATDATGRTGATSISVTVDNVPDPDPDPDPGNDTDPDPNNTGPTEGGAHWGGSASGNARTTTGKVFFTDGGLTYVCSGTLVDGDLADTTRPPIVMTAGHCVYDGGFVTNWMYYPDYESQSTSNCSQSQYGCWTSEAIVTTTAWASGDFERDVAFVRVGNGGLNNGPITDAIGASQGVGFYSALGQQVTDFGYPAASPYNGTELSWCAGETVTNTIQPSDVTQGLVCDMTGGSSGGAWLDNFDPASELGLAVSLNSYKYVSAIGPIIVSESDEMFGPIFGAWTRSVYETALTAPTNTLV